jgi:hypothetical protein
MRVVRSCKYSLRMRHCCHAREGNNKQLPPAVSLLYDPQVSSAPPLSWDIIRVIRWKVQSGVDAVINFVNYSRQNEAFA